MEKLLCYVEGSVRVCSIWLDCETLWICRLRTLLKQIKIKARGKIHQPNRIWNGGSVNNWNSREKTWFCFGFIEPFTLSLLLSFSLSLHSLCSLLVYSPQNLFMCTNSLLIHSCCNEMFNRICCEHTFNEMQAKTMPKKNARFPMMQKFRRILAELFDALAQLTVKSRTRWTFTPKAIFEKTLRNNGQWNWRIENR